MLATLVVDTIGPRVTDLDDDPTRGQIDLAFADERSGLNQATLIDGANYRISGKSILGSRRSRPFLITDTATTTPAGQATAAQPVSLVINNGRPIRGGWFDFTVRSGASRTWPAIPWTGNTTASSRPAMGSPAGLLRLASPRSTAPSSPRGRSGMATRPHSTRRDARPAIVHQAGHEPAREGRGDVPDGGECPSRRTDARAEARRPVLFRDAVPGPSVILESSCRHDRTGPPLHDGGGGPVSLTAARDLNREPTVSAAMTRPA